MQQALNGILALDVGERRVGVALANTIARMASPLITLENNDELFEKILMLAREHQIGTVVVGLPRGLEGQETAQTGYARDFADKLENEVKLPIVMQDEAVTSVAAEERLKASKKPYSKSDIDMYAAAEILQDYLDNLS